MNNKCEDEMPDCDENVDDKGDEEGDFFDFFLYCSHIKIQFFSSLSGSQIILLEFLENHVVHDGLIHGCLNIILRF